MVFIRSKKIKGKDYYYLVKSKRVNGKVKQKTLAYIGARKPTKKELFNLKKKHLTET